MISGEYSNIVENDIPAYNAKISRHIQIFVLRGLAGMQVFDLRSKIDMFHLR